MSAVVQGRRMSAQEVGRITALVNMEGARMGAATALPSPTRTRPRLRDVNSSLWPQEDRDAMEARLRDALPWVKQPDYDTFRKVFCAIKNALGDDGWPLADHWAENHAGGNYDKDENWVVWGGIEADKPGGATVATVFHLAKLAGWNSRPNQVQTENGAAPMVGSVDSQETVRRFNVLTAEDVAALAPQAEIIKGVIPTTGIASLFGPSGAGKSFVALNMAEAIANGAPWFGHRTKQRPVVVMALEGGGGLRSRVAAAGGAPGVRFVVHEAFDIRDDNHVVGLGASVVDACGSGAVVFLDTLNRAAPGADENSSLDMSRIIGGAGRLAELTGGLVVLVHHTGKDASKGMRGHSSLHAAMDAVIEVRRDGELREWAVTKAKDGEDGRVHSFRLEVVELGRDEDGDPITSCRVVADQSGRRIRTPSGANQIIALNRLRLMFEAGQVGGEGVPPGRRSVALPVAVEAVAAVMTCEQKRRRSIARATVGGLVAGGFLGMHEGALWLA